MLQPATRNLITEIIASLLILLFVYTATSKLIHLHSFRLTLSQSPFIGNFADFIAAVLPAAELLTALLLIIPALRKWGLLASLLLMTIFTLYIIYMILFASHLPCSCGGVIQDLGWRGHLWFNITVTFVALLGYKMNTKDKLFFRSDRGSRKPAEKSRQSLNF